AHHGKREHAILDIIRSGKPLTVYEIASKLWAKLPGYHLVLGNFEVNSHLEKLCDDGLVHEQDGRFGPTSSG
ncbi:MAG TPA: hypothetical protein VHV08_04315, partial [Pirellulales bacterium]|nr:hypothetical protein [Pirellulales bacterium]